MICFEFNFSGKKMFVNWWQSKTLQKYGQKCKFNYMMNLLFMKLLMMKWTKLKIVF